MGGMRIIRAARLWDGTSDRLVGEPLIAVDPDGRIAGVASGGEVPSDAEVIDLGTATVLPGLIDGHQHLMFDASLDPVGRLATVDDAEALDGMRVAASVALNAGITTVRDLGDRNFLTIALREEYAAAPGSGPRLLSAGPPLTTTRGHCWFFGGEAAGIDAIREGVRARAERGVDVLKVMASGGEMTEGTHSYEPQFSVDELRAAVDEAHGLGLKVTAHAHGVPAIANVIAAGVDLIEHASFLIPEGALVDEEVLARLVDSGITVSMTLGQVPGEPIRPRMAVLLPLILDAMGQLRAAGVPTVCSSDAGIGPAKPHDVLTYSVQTAVEAVGATPVEALRMVTSAAAVTCGIDDRAGRIAAGYDADLLAVDGDPLTDITALRNVAAVFRAGHRVR
jgi:imidazolonepropionase-like amidohydrolase